MTAFVLTITKPTLTQDTRFGNKKILIRDLTMDTGTYTTGGYTLTAAALGLKRIDFIGFGTNGMTGGTSGATANPIGVTYTAGGVSAVLQQYEAAATGLPLLQKTSAEAVVGSATFRIMVIGI